MASLCLAACLCLAHAVLIAANPAGPLGVSPGGPQGAIPLGAGGSDSSDNVTTTRNALFQRNVARGVNTSLAILCALLVTLTYAVLIGPGTRLYSTSKIPLGAIRTNIETLLSRAWPCTSDNSQTDSGQITSSSSSSSSSQDQDAIRLFYVGRMVEDTKGREARGILQCTGEPQKRIGTPSMWLTAGSTLTKCMVQLAVWEWVSIWMVLAMLFSTLLFNGFLTNERRTDSYPRLVVALIYLTGFCVHAWYVWRTCKSFFSLLGAGAAWSLLNKASFASVDLGQLKAGLEGGPTPVFRQVGKPASSPTFPPFEGCRLSGTNPIDGESTHTATTTDEDKGALDTVNDWQKREIGTTVEAGKIALERIVTNVMAMVGITITTGFAVWTSMADETDSTTQLGSLALLASLTIGTGAMFSSAVELSVMHTSFTNVLFLKELMINRQATAHVQKRARKKNVIGFTHNTIRMKPTGLRDLARYSKLWSLILFGPAYVLLPSEEDHSRQSAGAEFELKVAVRGKQVILTTQGTDRHQKNEEGGNLEAINVCYVPDAKSSRGNTPSLGSTYSFGKPPPEIQSQSAQVDDV